MKQTPAPPTVADLKRLFAERGIRPRRALGQNFLVEPALMAFVVRAARLEHRDVVLEPGAGTGGLTGLLASRAAAVIAVEKDAGLHAIASEVLAPFPNVTLLHADAMGKGGDLGPGVPDAVSAALSSVPDARFKVVANLPYQIGTAVITALLAGELVPAEMIVTVQREVADRICATHGCGEYGYLSVVVQTVARPRRLKRLSPKAFWPQPKVDSCILRITPDPKLRAAAGDLAALQKVAGGLFQYRRKQVARALFTAGLASDLAQARRFLGQAGVNATTRPEDLTVRDFVSLTAALVSERRFDFGRNV